MVSYLSGTGLVTVIANSAAAAYQVPSTAQTPVSYATGTAGVAITAGTGLNLRTVTGTKTLYVTQFNIAASTGGAFEINDGGAAGTPKIGGYVYAGTTLTMTFPTPVLFTTNCWLDPASSATCYLSMQGFEQ